MLVVFILLYKNYIVFLPAKRIDRFGKFFYLDFHTLLIKKLNLICFEVSLSEMLVVFILSSEYGRTNITVFSNYKGPAGKRKQFFFYR